MSTVKEHLRLIYQENGVVFNEGKAELNIGTGNKLFINEAILLEPSEKNLTDLVKELDLLEVEYELFDPKDPQYETEIAGVKRRNMGRAFHHWEWDYDVFPPEKTNYYKYMFLEADSSQVSDDAWEKLALYLVCVIATLGILIVLGLVTNGMSVYASIAVFSAVAAACLAFLDTVSEGAARNARIKTYVDT
jgi:hypothetical protein